MRKRERERKRSSCQREGDTEQEMISWDSMSCKVPAKPNHSVAVEVLQTPQVTPLLLSAEQALGKDRGVEEQGFSTGSAAGSFWWMFCVQNRMGMVRRAFAALCSPSRASKEQPWLLALARAAPPW